MAALCSGVFSGLALSPPASAASRRGVGLGLGYYQGPTTNYVMPTTIAPGVVFMSVYGRSKHLDLISKIEVVLFPSGNDFAGSGSAWLGFAGVYKFQPNYFFIGEGWVQPYLTGGPMLAAFGFFLTSISTSNNVSNNQASLKLGLTIGVGAHILGGSDRKSGKGFNYNMEYFYFLPSPSILEFQGGKLGSRGIHVTLSWFFAG